MTQYKNISTPMPENRFGYFLALSLLVVAANATMIADEAHDEATRSVKECNSCAYYPAPALVASGTGGDVFPTPLPVDEGGTGDSYLTPYSVLIGEGVSPVEFAVPGNTGIPLVSTGSASNPAFGTALVIGGGTGATSFTAYAPVCGGTNTTAPLQSATGMSTTNNFLVSNGAGSLPSFKTLSRNQQVFTTAGAGVYTPSSGMIFCVVEAVAGGGGSGGVAATSNATSSGGGSGSYSRKVLTAAQVGTTMAYVVGSGGSAGTAAATSGTNGVATTFGGTWVTTVGGTGGVTGGVTAGAGGAGGALGTGGVFTGNAGGGTVAASVLSMLSGPGGSAPAGFGAGGYAVPLVTAPIQGNNGQGFGSGASGSTAGIGSAAAIAGATGAGGAIIVTEYCIN